MTYEELAGAKVIVEIDDVRHARTLVSETIYLSKELRMYRVAELVVALREHYVRLGRDLQKTDRCY